MTNDKFGVTVYYKPPVHKTPYYERLASSNKNDDLAKTEWASEHVLSLPVHPSVTNQDIERMVHSLKNTL